MYMCAVRPKPLDCGAASAGRFPSLLTSATGKLLSLLGLSM